ncbi:uncharacterized protein LOC132258167 [Phlebotomus argentipes]|uniref:uncharacterized protein LOC132258167 n=1 Tax=Phlebotomus argentipes TaxID=94469 RepID=UPI00289326A1|nr:uncharacterized protein LOC132258167 [Phlebotomus argentipes]
MYCTIIKKNRTIYWHDVDTDEPTGRSDYVRNLVIIILIALGLFLCCLRKKRSTDSINQPHERTNIVGNSCNQTSARSQYFNLNELQSDQRPIGTPTTTQEQQNPRSPHNEPMRPMPMPSMVATAPPEHPPPPADDAKPPSYEQVTQVMGDKNG